MTKTEENAVGIVQTKAIRVVSRISLWGWCAVWPDALQPCGRRKTVSPIIFGTSCLGNVY